MSELSKAFYYLSHRIEDRECKFDDLVMGGRKRINKGSKNFHNFLNQSSESRKFFKNINNFKYFKKIQNYFDKKKRNYVLANNQKKFEFSKLTTHWIEDIIDF